MKNKLKITTAAIVLMCGLIGPVVFSSATVSAQIKNNVCGGAELSVGAGSCASRNSSGDCVTSTGAAAAEARCDAEGGLDKLVTNIVNVLSVIVGILAVIMIILGGFKYITSGGDSGNIGSAKTTIIYAIVGLVIVTLAQVIVRFVLSKA